MVQTKRIRELELRPMKRRVSSWKYWTRCLASRTSLAAASFAMPINLPPGASSGKSIGARFIFAFCSPICQVAGWQPAAGWHPASHWSVTMFLAGSLTGVLGGAIAFMMAAVLVAVLGLGETTITFVVLTKVLFWVF